MVFYIKNVNEIIASVAVEQRLTVEYVSYGLKILKNDLRFKERHTDPLIIPRKPIRQVSHVCLKLR